MNATPLLATPPTVTTTCPGRRAAGDPHATILVAAHDVGVAVIPLNGPCCAPCVVPKFAPADRHRRPDAPDVGDRLVILGADRTTVNATPLLATPPTVTTTVPGRRAVGTRTTILVAAHDVGVAVVPLKRTRAGALRRPEVRAR